MPSIASMVLDHYNGVKPITADDTIPFPPAPSPRKPKRQPVPPVVMTEGMLKNKEMLRNTLRVGIWTIEFTKVDGTPAIMECTLDKKFLPPIDPTKINVKPRNEESEPEHLLHVYATDRNGWRSFVVPNVTKIYKKVENS
jgi:hypothetical protein